MNIRSYRIPNLTKGQLSILTVVILTWDPDSPGFWLTQDYFPEILEHNRSIFPSMGELMFIKVCGLKTKEQIDKAVEYGYDAIGVVTYPKSKRYCQHDVAIELAEYAKGKIKTFVVGLTFRDVENAAYAFDYTQIYEARQIPNLVLASKETPPLNLKYEYFLYDASIGSGVFKGFPSWVRDKANEIILAGGLNAENVCSVIQDLKPFGVDVSSGVETNGIKDLKLMKKFIEAVKGCQPFVSADCPGGAASIN